VTPPSQEPMFVCVCAKSYHSDLFGEMNPWFFLVAVAVAAGGGGGGGFNAWQSSSSSSSSGSGSLSFE